MLVWSPQTNSLIHLTLVEAANAFITRCKALYKVAILPREKERFMAKIKDACALARKAVVDGAEGWTVKKRVGLRLPRNHSR